MSSSDKTTESIENKEPLKPPFKSPTIHGGFGTIATPANNIGGDPVRKYRRSSSHSTAASGSSPRPLFAGLMSQKRGSTDAAAQARRQSFQEQKPTTGYFGTWWEKFTTGSK